MFTTEYKLRWADIDANRHLRHSAYADYAAHARVEYLDYIGMSFEEMGRHDFGPIIFREELLYMREVSLADGLRVTVQLIDMSADGRKFAFVCQLYKLDGTHACTVNVSGGWLNLSTRKLAPPPAAMLEKLRTQQETHA